MFAGILAFMVLKLITGRAREVGTVMWGFGVTLLLAKLAQAWAAW